MKLTTSQYFQIATAIVSFGVLIASLFPGIDPGVVAKVGAGLTGLISTVGSIVTNPQAQVQAVVARAGEPAVQGALVKTVANYPGIDPIQTNSKASPALISVAADPTVPKVLPPKP